MPVRFDGVHGRHVLALSWVWAPAKQTWVGRLSDAGSVRLGEVQESQGHWWLRE